jgi:hypothetical protein
MIRRICEVFGNVKDVELVMDSHSERFTGIVNVEFSSENEAKRASSAMMGLGVGDCVLDVRKIAPLEGQNFGGADGEMFRQLTEDKPTCCLCLKNVVILSEIENRIDYKELEFDVEDEMIRYGKVVKVCVPRPPLFGDPFSMVGFGRVYVRFREIEEAKRAKESLFKRRFNGRAVEA